MRRPDQQSGEACQHSALPVAFDNARGKDLSDLLICQVQMQDCALFSNAHEASAPLLVHIRCLRMLWCDAWLLRVGACWCMLLAVRLGEASAPACAAQRSQQYR